MITWIKNNFPGTFNWISDFFAAMSAKRKGHSLTKWLAVGCFFLLAYITVKHTDNNNLTTVSGVLVGLITTLTITKAVSTHQEIKLDKLPDSNQIG